MKKLDKLALLACALGAPGCTSLQGIDSVRPTLENLSTAAAAAETYVSESSDVSVRNYRLAYLIEDSLAPEGAVARTINVGAPDAFPAPTGEEWRTFARDVLCNTQDERLAGSLEVAGASELARSARSFDVVEPSDSILGNLALLHGSAGRTPQLAALGVGTDAPAGYNKIQNDCIGDVSAAGQGRIRTGEREASAGAILDLASALNDALRAKTVALLQILVNARRLSDLRAYLRANRDDILQLAETIRNLSEPMTERAQLLRRMTAYNYLTVFDSYRVEAAEASPAPADPSAISPARVDIRGWDSTASVLDAASAYDDAMSEGAPQAFEDLADAIEALLRIETDPLDAGSAAASLRATMSFLGALRSLADATQDEDLKKAIENVFPPNRRPPAPAPEES